MKVNANPLTGTTSVQVESRIMKLQFVCTSLKGARTDPKEILTDLANAKVELEKQTVNGGQPVLPEMPFNDLIEIASANEGCIDMRTEGANFVLRATVEISDHGAIEPVDGEFFKLSLVAFTNVNVDVYAMDADKTSATHNVYRLHYLNANTPKTLDIANARWIAIPDTHAKKLELVDETGRLITYEKEELRQLCNEGNDIAANADGKIFPGYLNLLVLNISDAVQARITTTANTQVYAVYYETF